MKNSELKASMSHLLLLLVLSDVPPQAEGTGKVSEPTPISQAFSFYSPSLIEGVGVSKTVQGIQDTGVIATVKHYIANEQVGLFLF